MQRRAAGLLVLAVVLALAVAMPLSSPTDAARPPRPSPSPTASPSPTPSPTLAPVQIYGAWHCSNDYCTWGSVRDMEEFDSENHWLIDRDPMAAVGLPSVNLVVLSFVHPLNLLNRTTDATTLDGLPRGMTHEIVSYFESRGIRVMLSIGGIIYVDAWNQALTVDAWQLGLNAAAVATHLGVGIEIDYEENTDPLLPELEQFIRAYRSVHPYDASGGDPTARLTIDLAAGDRWLIGLTREATESWLLADTVAGRDLTVQLDYANAMVPARQPSYDKAIANWQEHVDGKPQYAPPIAPLAPAKLAGSVYVAEGSQVRPECTSFASSLQNATGSFVQSVASKIAGTTSGMLGWMFWAAEKPSTRGVGTVPPNTCEGGVGVGATTYGIPIPMPALRQR